MITISLEKAKPNKLFYFVVTGTIYHPEKKKCLILQRSKKETAHPGLWGVVGGKLEWSDLESNQPTKLNHDIPNWDGLVEKLLEREAFEEAGLAVEDSHYLDSVVFLRPDNVPVVCFKFAVKYKNGEVKIAPEFDNFAWVDEREVKTFQIIQGIDQEVSKTIKVYTH
jgi:ADP-ribose pyrophosphatase YjhB (NUDIX family)